MNPDRMVAHYLALADEGTKAAKNKEAEMLFATAESELDDLEDHEAALEAATEALQLSRSSGDKVAIVDALRTIMKCYCSKLQNLPLEQDIKGMSAWYTAEEKKSTMSIAKELASKELASFKDQKDARGEAAMSLSLAEVAMFDSETTDCVKLVEEALELCKKSGDGKLEASACLALVSALMKAENLSEAYLTAIKAVAAFRSAGDKKGEAKALHAQGVVADQSDKDGMPAFKQALMICKDEGFKKMEGLELHHIAARLISKDNAKLAVPFAKEAVGIFASEASGKRWHWIAVGTYSKALVLKGDEKVAIKFCADAVAASKKADSKVATIFNLQNLFTTHMTSPREGDPMKAVTAAMDMINLSMAEGLRKLEANGRLNLAQVMLRFWRLDMAMHWARTATGIYKQLEDTEAETDAQNMIVATYLKGSKFEHALDAAEELVAALQAQGRTVREAAANLHMAQVILQKMVSTAAPEFDPSKIYGWGQSNINAKEGAKEHDVTLEDAEKKAKDCIAAFKQAGDKKSEGMAWEFMAALQYQDGELGDPVASMQSAASLYSKCSDFRAQAFVLQQVTQILLDRGSGDAAVVSAQEAVTVARKTRDLKLEVQLLLALSHAQTRRSLKKMEKSNSENDWIRGESGALQPAREAVALCRKLKDRYALPMALTAVAEVHCLGGQLDDAQKVIEDALAIYREDWENGDYRMNNVSGEGRTLLVAAEVYFMRKEEQLARDTMDQANKLFTAAHDEIGVQMVAECLEGFAVKETFKPTAGAAAVDVVEDGAVSSAAETAVEKKAGISYDVAKLIVLDKIAESVGEVDEVHMDTPLMDAGLDSLAAVSFRTMLQDATNLKLPSSIVFDYPDPKSLIEFMVEESMA